MPLDREFVRCRHADVEGTAVLARSALKHMPGWEPVEDDAPTATAAAPTTAAAPAPTVALTKES